MDRLTSKNDTADSGPGGGLEIIISDDDQNISRSESFLDGDATISITHQHSLSTSPLDDNKSIHTIATGTMMNHRTTHLCWIQKEAKKEKQISPSRMPTPRQLSTVKTRASLLNVPSHQGHFEGWN